MTTPISIAQQIHQRDNPVGNPNLSIEALLQQLISGLPSTEVHFGPDPPDNPIEGDLWYHPDENRLYAYAE